jgi:hypothetical protein
LTLALLLLGLGLRLMLYAANWPLWHDEASLALNFLDRDAVGLTRQLDNRQVAPVLFLWGELAVIRLLGTAEWALRLIPLLAALGGLTLFWLLARRTVAPSAALCAVGLLAVSRWPVDLSCQVKPYSLDLLFAVALPLLAVLWLERPERLIRLGLLALLVPVALAASFPAVFVAGGVGLALLPAAWRGGARARALFGLYGALVAAAFLVCDVWLGERQLGPPGGGVDEFMQSFWATAFPPGHLSGLLPWLARSTVKFAVAYPFCNSNTGTGTVMLLLFLAGAAWCWRGGCRPLLVLCLAPFALHVAAALLRKYPYGVDGRICQHLAPAACLLAGIGLAGFIEALARRLGTGLRAAVPCCAAALALFGVSDALASARRPYHYEEEQWTRCLVREVLRQAGPGERIVVRTDPTLVRPVGAWYLRHLGADRIVWSAHPEGPSPEGRLWYLHLWVREGWRAGAEQEEAVPEGPSGLLPVVRVPYTFACDRPWLTFHADLCCYAPVGTTGTGRPKVSVWP